MKEKRLGWLEVENKNKKLRATQKKLERMDKKVEHMSLLFYLLLIKLLYINSVDLNFESLFIY